MRIKVLTIFPEMLRPMLEESILGRAIAAGRICVELIDIRAYSRNKHKNTDDYPFGGGAGMVMLAQPIVDAMEACTGPMFSGRRIYMSPRGRTLNQKIVEELAGEEELVLLCGHYEGVDQRALDMCVDEELSVGDYVLTGGELAAMVVIDSVARLLPGVLGSEESAQDESFTTGLLEYPQYTRPREFRGKQAPEVLFSGHHANIVRWQREHALKTTLQYRPEMLESAPLDKKDAAYLTHLRQFGDAEAEMASRVYFTRTDAAEELPRLAQAAGIGDIDFSGKRTAIKVLSREAADAPLTRATAEFVRSMDGTPFVTDAVFPQTDAGAMVSVTRVEQRPCVLKNLGGAFPEGEAPSCPRVAESALAACKNRPCFHIAQLPGVGLMASYDPVALERACGDLLGEIGAICPEDWDPVGEGEIPGLGKSAYERVSI